MCINDPKSDFLKKIYYPASPQETFAIGEELSQSLYEWTSRWIVICFFGELGAGKTTFIKGLAHGLHINSTEVNSPTFQYLNIYKGKNEFYPLFHFDLYRLRSSSDFLAMGFEEYLYPSSENSESPSKEKGVVCIEWAERIEQLLPKETILVRITHAIDGGREIEIGPLLNT